MWFNFLYLVFLLGVAKLSSAQQNSPTYNFEVFLENALKSYPAWLRSNNHDPSTPNPKEILLLDTSYYYTWNMTMKIKEEQVVNYANEANTLVISAKVDYNRQFIYLTLNNTGAIKYQGKYSVNGGIYNDTLYEGDGTWIYSSPAGVSENATFRYHIQPNGYATLLEGREKYSILPNIPVGDLERNVEFEGFLAESFDDFDLNKVSNMFVEKYEETRIKELYDEHPTFNLLHSYLKEIFEKTHFLDIIED